MSTWTHINGSIRYDTFNLKEEEEPAFHQVKSGGDEIEWDNCDVPYGSEGSISISKNTIYENDAQKFITYSFSGDLRNYSYEDNKDDLEDWINNLIPKSDGNYNLGIRQGIFEIEYEDEGLFIYVFDSISNNFKILKNSI